MAISFKEKLAYINKYAKGNDKLVKAVQLGKALEKVKDDTQREKIKKAVNDAFTQIKKINTASSTKTSTAKTAQTKQDKIEKEIEKFKKSIGRSKWITATRYMTNSGLRKTTIEKDAQVPALPKGKRISRKTGKPYWENRANRSDVKQPPVDYPKLARGGYIEIDKLYFIGTPEVTSVDKNGRKSGDWKYIVVDKNGNKTESILKMKFNEDPKDVRTNTENAEYVTQQQFDRMYDKMKGKMAKGGEVGNKEHNFWLATIKMFDGSIGDEGIIADTQGEAEHYADLKAKGYGKVLSVKHIRKFAEGGQIGSGKNGYVAFYKGKRIEVYADTMYQAQQLAAKHFKAKKEWEVNVVLAEVDGKPYIQSTAFANGGEMEKIDQRMYNFLEDDLATLEQSINEDDQETIEKFFSYWIGTNGHLKSLKTKSNERMYNFLEDDLATLEQSIIKNDNEKIEQFFSYWGQHLNSIRYAKGGAVGSYKKEEYMKPIGKVSYYFYIYNEDGERDDILYFDSFQDAKNEYDAYANHQKEDVIYYNVNFETNFAPFSFETGVVTPNGKRIAQIREGVSVQS